MNTTHMYSIIALGLMVASCGNSVENVNGNSPSTNQNQVNNLVVEDLPPREFYKKLTEEEDYILLDVRTDREVAEGIIAGAIHIDFYDNDFRGKIKNLPAGKPVYVYCAVGGRSSNAKQLLASIGYTEVFNLAGGIEAWKVAGLPVQNQ